MSEPFTAEIRIFAGNFAPRGWAFCDGQLLPISQNTALFSLIGTTYGGDGRTTTALPDLQGRAPMHPGRGPGLTSRRLGEKIGVQTITLNSSQMPSHTHPAQADAEAGGTFGGGADSATPIGSHLGNTTAAGEFFSTGATDAPMNSAAIENTGSSQAHNNMQPYLTLNFIIALQGLYPSRG